MSPFLGATDAPILDFWSPLGFKARVGSALFELSGGVHVTLYIPWDSPLVWHLLTSWWPAWQLSCLFHIPARHWSDSKLGAIMLLLTVWDQADALPTELSRLGLSMRFLVLLYSSLRLQDCKNAYASCYTYSVSCNFRMQWSVDICLHF